MGSGRQVVAVGAVLAALLLAVALLASAAGPAAVGDSPAAGLVDGPLLQAPEQLSETEPEAEPRDEEEGLPRWFGVLGVLGVSLLLALVWRLVRRVEAGTPAPARPDPATGDAAGDPETAVLDELRKVVDDAARDLARPDGDAADAVVACWERLEDLGASAGTPRAPHETATEYVADLLRAHGADAGAVADLLALFHRARFGSGDLPPDAGTRAADALARVAATLGPARVPGA